MTLETKSTELKPAEPKLSESRAGEAPIPETAEASTPFISSAQKVADMIEKQSLQKPRAVEEPAEQGESEPEITESDIENMSDEELMKLVEDETSDSQSKIGVAEENAASAAEESSPDSEDKTEGEGKSTSRMQKRIDTIVSREKAAIAERDELKEKVIRMEEQLKFLTDSTKKPEEVKAKDERISDGQLQKILQECIDKGDSQGILDVINYKNKMAKDDLVAQYNNAENAKVERTKREQVQWQTLVKEYVPDAYKTDILRDDTDFDIRNTKGALFDVASKLYYNPQKEYMSRKEGLLEAVRDAFVMLLRTKELKPAKKSNSEADGLKNRLAKERRKNVPSGGASSMEEGKPKMKTPKDELAEVLAERKAYKRKRTGIGEL